MTTDKQLDANRQNALNSTGPQTADGVQACKMNAVRHGLRSVQTVVLGEDPGEWEAHLGAVVVDLAPVGAMEIALAEQVAAKLWRLGRVVRYEADLITNAQAEDELLRAHEATHRRLNSSSTAKRTDIPTRKDVADAKEAVEKAAKKLAVRVEALGYLQALATMKDEDAFPDWTLYETLKEDFRIDDYALERLFKGEDDEGPFRARHARKMIATATRKSGEVEELREALAVAWAEKLEQLKKESHGLQAKHKSLARRYKAAVERRRRASGLPGPKDLDRIQRYEAHLERGLHKALDRLRDLQAARGAVPPRGPSVAVAVVHAGPQNALGGEMGPFGSLAIETAGEVQEPVGADAQG